MSDPYARSQFDKSPGVSGREMRFDDSVGSVRNILESARYAELDRKQSYYDCTQHDLKQYDFDGRIISSARAFSQTQPLLTSAVAPFYVPLTQRRPHSPYRLARSTVHAFTDMLFGQGRFPSPSCPEDSASQEFVRALVAATSLPSKLLQTRNLGGSQGSAGLSWCYVDGAPSVEVHNSKQLWVQEWANREALIPAHVTEVFLYEKDLYDSAKREYYRQWFWKRRDWTTQADIVFRDVPFVQKVEPYWEIDPECTVMHNEGECHFVWVQNTLSHEVDGQPDYHGQYEMFDSIDLLFSVITRGTTLNLDPTLKLRMDPELINRQGIRKGSDNALILGETGEASYLEMSGSGINSGLAVLKEKRHYTLESMQCVIPEPEQIAAQGTSSVALKMIYAPMLSRCDQFRDTYGDAIERLLSAMLRAAQKYSAELTTEVVGEDGQAHTEFPKFDLPTRQVTQPVIDPMTGEPTSELQTLDVPQDPGIGKRITLAWGPYFPPTEADKQTSVSLLQSANGGKPLLSHQTSSEVFASILGRDSTQEWNRLQDEATKAASQQASMGGAFAGDADHIGGTVQDENELPPGALPTEL